MESQVLGNNATIQEFSKIVGEKYKYNKKIHSVNIRLNDGTGPLEMKFNTQRGLVQNQESREGTLIIGSGKPKRVRFETLREMMMNSYNFNNHVYSIECELYDENNLVRLLYTTPKGFVLDQSERRGKIELN